MLPLSLFNDREFSVVSCAGLAINTAFYGLIFVLSFYFQRLEQFSALSTGLVFTTMMGAVFLTNLMAVRIAGFIGPSRTIACGVALMIAGCIPLIRLIVDESFWRLFPPFVLLGGGGLLVPPLTSTLLARVDKSRSGIASGVLNSARQTGGVIGVALLGSLISGPPSNFIAGARTAAIIATVLLAGALANVLWGLRPLSGRLETLGVASSSKSQRRPVLRPAALPRNIREFRLDSRKPPGEVSIQPNCGAFARKAGKPLRELSFELCAR
jgi:MFS transporter, DHA2 family, methylenomycin A resistance protein